MATDFGYNRKTINSSGPIKPTGINQPLDPRTEVKLYADIKLIPNPYIGMIITVLEDETNSNKMTDYKVLSLKSDDLGVANSVIDRVQKYSEYLGVNTGGSVDLSGYATKDELNSKANTSDIPTNTSELNNDSGFLTSIPSEYVTETEMNEAIANVSSGGSVSQEDINTAVNNYLTEHPVTGGATAEQANQIEANKTNIITLKELVEKPITFDKLDRGLSNLFEPKFNPISFSWDVDKGGYNKDGFNNDSTWSKAAIPVIEGEKYKITGYVLGKSRLFILGDENKSYTSSSVMYPDYEQTVSQWTLYKDIEVTIPSGYKYLLISTADRYIGYSIIKKENEYLNKRAEEVNTELLKNIQELKDNTTVYSYSVYTPAWVDGKYFNSDQKIVNTMDGWSCVELSVNIGDSFKISGHTNQWVPLYCLVDKDNEIIQINERTSQLTELFNEVVTVRNDNCKLYVNSRLNCTTIMKNDGLISKSQDEVLTLQTENKALKKRIIEEQIKNDFAWKDFDKIYITFTFDDTLQDISDIVSLFKSKGVPVCLATVYMRLGITTNSGKTALEVCKECEENGGEILSHHTLPLTSTRTDDDYNEVIVNSYFELTKKGLNIDGIITTGGTDDNGNDWHTGDFNKCVELMRPYYKYSDLYGYNTGVTQYFHQRKFLTTDDAVNKGFIDSAISEGNQWISFASHGVNDNVTSTLLTSLLDYIATKDNVEIVTFRYLHNKFGTTKLEKSVTDNASQLEEGSVTPDKTSFLKNMNLFNCANAIPDKKVLITASNLSDEGLTESTKWCVSELIPCKAGEKYTVNKAGYPSTTINNTVRVAREDKSCNGLDVTEFINNGDGTYTFTIPEGAVYFRWMFTISESEWGGDNWKTKAMLVKGTTISSIFYPYNSVSIDGLKSDGKEYFDVLAEQDIIKINNKINSLENALNIKLQEKVLFYGNGLGRKVLNAVVGSTIGFTDDPYRNSYEVLIEENTDYFLSNCRSRNNSQAWAIVDKNYKVLSCGKYEDIETGLLIKGMPNAYKLYFSMDNGSVSALYRYTDNFVLYNGDKVDYNIVSSTDVPMKKSLNTIEGKNSYIINFSNSGTKNTITIPVTASNFNTIGFWVNMKFFDVLKITKISIDYLKDSTSLFTSEISQDNLKFEEWFFHKLRVDKAYTVNNIKLTVTFENSGDNVHLEISPFIVLNQFSIPTVAINFDHAWKASEDCGLYDKLINNNIPFTITGQFNCEEATKQKLLNACANGLVDLGMYGNEVYSDGNYEIADTSTDYMTAVTNINKCLNKKIEDGIIPVSFGPRGHVITPLVSNIVKNNGFKVIRNLSSGYANNSLFSNKEFLCITTRPFITVGLDKIPLSGNCFALFAHGVSSNPSGEEKPNLYYNWTDVEQVINTLITMRDDGKIKILNFKQIYDMYKR